MLVSRHDDDRRVRVVAHRPPNGETIFTRSSGRPSAFRIRVILRLRSPDELGEKVLARLVALWGTKSGVVFTRPMRAFPMCRIGPIIIDMNQPSVSRR